MRAILSVLCVCGPLAGQMGEAPPAVHERFHSVLWVQTSVEHDALYIQAYRQAREMLDRARKDKTWTAAVEQRSGYQKLPPAVILDIDETVLDNSPEEAEAIRRGTPYSEQLWNDWVRLERAPALPGALEFTRYAASRHVEVLYVTNRNVAVKEATRRALARAGFPLHEGVETLFCAGEKPGDTEKSARREALAARYRILLLIGDDLGDFMPGVRVPPEERRRLAATYAARWGERWIVLPNPMYGSWEDTLFGFDRGVSTPEKIRRKREYLRPMSQAAGAASGAGQP
ncbi:MAG TPA: HAD family acid phosphatase [Bryobacteraceae bacterium]